MWNNVQLNHGEYTWLVLLYPPPFLNLFFNWRKIALQRCVDFYNAVSHVKMLVAHSCCDPLGFTRQASLPMEFSRQEYWSGLPFPSPGTLPDPGIEPGSPALQANSLPS